MQQWNASQNSNIAAQRDEELSLQVACMPAFFYRPFFDVSALTHIYFTDIFSCVCQHHPSGLSLGVRVNSAAHRTDLSRTRQDDERAHTLHRACAFAAPPPLPLPPPPSPHPPMPPPPPPRRQALFSTLLPEPTSPAAPPGSLRRLEAALCGDRPKDRQWRAGSRQTWLG